MPFILISSGYQNFIDTNPDFFPLNVIFQKLFHTGILRSREKEGAYTLCNGMDGTGEHYAK